GGGGGGGRGGHLGQHVHVLVLVPSQEVHGGVVRDAIQPGPERRRLVHLAEREVGLGQRVLHHVLAVEHRAGHVRAVAMQLGPHLGHEIHEALPRIGDRQQERVAHPSGSTPFPLTAIAVTPAATSPRSPPTMAAATFCASSGTSKRLMYSCGVIPTHAPYDDEARAPIFVPSMSCLGNTARKRMPSFFAFACVCA